MATTLNRTFFGGSTAPGSGVYPEDVKLLKIYRNYAETEYDPLANSDTSVYIPTVEKVDSSGTNIHVTIQKILASGGYPILIYDGSEYCYIRTTNGRYVFTCINSLNMVKQAEVNTQNGTITAGTGAVGGISVLARNESDLSLKITTVLALGRMPVILDNGEYYNLVTENSTHFIFASVADGLVETLSVNKTDSTVTTNVASTVKFVDASLAQVTDAVAKGYLPMIKRPAGQGYKYFHLQWVGSEAWFASVGAEEISRLVITGSDVTEITDKLRDVIKVSLVGGGSYVSNTDYNEAWTGANNNRIVVLCGASGSVTSQGYLIAVGSVGLRFMRVNNDKVQLVNVSPTETPDGHAVTYEDLANGGFTDIVDFDFTDYTDSVAGNIAYPIANNKMQIQSDWDGGLNNQAVFIAPSDTNNNAIVKLENVQVTITWNVQIWNHSKTALLPLVPGSATVFKKDASYVIHLYGDKVYVSQVVNKESAPVTEDDLKEAINTLRSRSVFVMDVGEIAGQVNLNPNGTAGFIGTLFSPYMDFDLSVDTNTVFDVEQMGNQGEMTGFVIALYEYNSATGEFSWVANTGDLSTRLDSTDRRLGLHSGKLQYIRQNAKLYGGKMYYAVACGHWNGWAFAGNTFATTLHSSVTPAFQCDNRSVVIDPATLGSGSYAKLYATDQSDQTRVDYHNISGNRMFMAFTNASVNI